MYGDGYYFAMYSVAVKTASKIFDFQITDCSDVAFKSVFRKNDSMELAKKVQSAIEEQLKKLSRYDIARPSIDNNGKIIIVDSIEQAIEISNEIAPEHLELCVDNPFDYLGKVRHAGSVFMGKHCPEALGDYLAGPNHTLPTSGTAKFSSPLSVDDFVKKSSIIYYSREALEPIHKDIIKFAESEQLTAHANSIKVRFEEEN